MNELVYEGYHIKYQNFMAPFNGWDSAALKLEPIRGDSLLFTTKFPEIPGTHFADDGRMKVNLWATNQTCTETHKIAKLLWPEM